MQPVTYDIWHKTFDIHAYKLLWIMQRKVPLNGTPKNTTYNNAKNMSDRHQCNFPQKYMQNNINNCSDFTCLMKLWQTGKLGRPTNKQTDIGKLHFPWYYYHKACHNPPSPVYQATHAYKKKRDRRLLFLLNEGGHGPTNSICLLLFTFYLSHAA